MANLATLELTVLGAVHQKFTRLLATRLLAKDLVQMQSNDVGIPLDGIVRVCC